MHKLNQTLISAEGVFKKYCRNLEQSMLYGLHDVTLDILNIASDYSKLRKDEFWVLSDISFKLKKGEVLGILGSNGAGKSTLLKLVSGIIYPDSGSIRTNGRVGELIEIAAGFHPMLTGRENIYIKGAILGMTGKEINNIFDEIVGFADLEEFIDSPVKYYSSGMYMRLGFSIIVHSRPDILLIDEVLSVGDVSFRAKSFNKINEIISDSGAVFVSHNMGDVARICNKVLVLNKGKCVFYGKDVKEGIDCYYRECSADNSLSVSGSGKAILDKIFIESFRDEQSMVVLGPSDELILNLAIRVSRQIPRIDIVITVTNLEERNVIQANSHFDSTILVNSSDRLNIKVNMGRLYLNAGIYNIMVSIHKENHTEVLGRYSNCLQFRISSDRIGYSDVQVPAVWELQSDQY